MGLLVQRKTGGKVTTQLWEHCEMGEPFEPPGVSRRLQRRYGDTLIGVRRAAVRKRGTFQDPDFAPAGLQCGNKVAVIRPDSATELGRIFWNDQQDPHAGTSV